MVRKARHRDRVLAFIATRQRDPQQAVGLASILMKEFVKITHPEQQQRTGTGRLRFFILFHHRRGDHGHMLAIINGSNQVACQFTPH